MASALRSFVLTLCAVAGAATLAGGCANKQPPVVLKNRYKDLPPKVVPEFLKNTIVERVDFENTEPLNVNNFGLVANLVGPTGDAMNVPMFVREYILKEMVKNGFGSARTPGLERLTPEEMLHDPRVAIVRVDGLIPAGARKGQRFDVAVSAMDNNNTSSVRGGMLYQCDLKINGADPRNPGMVIDEQAVVQGPVFVNPAYAMSDPEDPKVKASLRYGVVMDRGVVLKDRSILLRIRAPQLAMSRRIQWRINDYFHDETVAAAYDEGYVQIYMPRSFNGDWEHFLGVASHLYFDGRAEYSAIKARQLADEAQKPGAPLMDISYCWEGLGSHALPHIIPLMNSSSPDVAFAAARAAAYIGESSALPVLLDMARSANHPFQLPAVQVLGSLPNSNSPVISQMLRTLLDAPETTVRLEAYRLLAAAGDQSIYTRYVGHAERRFALDIIPTGGGAPLIYATRRGAPRIAIFGARPMLEMPTSFATMDNRLTITADPGDRLVKIFYRDPAVLRPAPVLSNPDIAELIARLAGEGADGTQQKLEFGYSDIVAIVQAMTQNQRVVALAGSNSQRMPVPFVLQSVSRVHDEVQGAPAIPERGRPQGGAGADTDAPSPPVDDPSTNHAEARE